MMRGGTGSKKRVIRALDANMFKLFSFNRSINPHGGTLAKIEVHISKKEKCRTKIYQDINSDGKVLRNELIFDGINHEHYPCDELINFSGSIRLKKTMHRCNWLSMKFPNRPIMCTKEYIPTTYQLFLFAEGGEMYEFEGIGPFQDPIFK